MDGQVGSAAERRIAGLGSSGSAPVEWSRGHHEQERGQRSVGFGTHGIADTLLKHLCAKRLGDGTHTMVTSRLTAAGVWLVNPAGDLRSGLEGGRNQ